MRFYVVGGLLGLMVVATVDGAGDAPRQTPYREQATEEVTPLLGEWTAPVQTHDGWNGTLKATVSLQRNHPEDSFFHGHIVLRYNLKLADRKPEVVVAGTEKIAILPYLKDRQRYLQVLRDYAIMQKEFALETLQSNSRDKIALKQLATLQPSPLNMAAYSLQKGGWTLELAPAVLAFLPRTAPSKGKDLNIDWDGSIVWKKVKAK